MEIIYKDLDELHPYEKNNKNHDSKQVKNVAESIKQYGFVQPLVIDKNNVVVIGHCRLLAAKKLKLKQVPCLQLENLNDEQIRKLRIVDNKTNESEWNVDNLLSELEDLDFSDFDFDLLINDPIEKEEHEKLTDKFIVPPFSIFDTRQGYWQDRKKQWLDLGIKSELGRSDNLISEGLQQLSEKTNRNFISSTSIFDPVLCEIMYKWFCTPKGKIYDCFAGGVVRGAVASKLEYEYYGIDLRQEQIDENIKQAKQLKITPHYYCDDSANADKYISDNSCDMIFSCPPYYDLELYSDNKQDLSNMEYEDFCKAYETIINVACKKLKENRFAVFVVGDIRDKKGAYRNFVDLTKKYFNSNGLITYNECILINALGTAPVRANKVFNSGRKLVKVHQNVLIFYKGDVKKILKNYPMIEIDESIFDKENEK